MACLKQIYVGVSWCFAGDTYVFCSIYSKTNKSYIRETKIHINDEFMWIKLYVPIWMYTLGKKDIIYWEIFILFIFLYRERLQWESLQSPFS